MRRQRILGDAALKQPRSHVTLVETVSPKKMGRCFRGEEHLPSCVMVRMFAVSLVRMVDCRGERRSNDPRIKSPNTEALQTLLLGFLLRGLLLAASLGCLTFLCHLRHLLS
jgi:hypothetical protein